MNLKLLDRMRGLQEAIRQIGLGEALLALSAPNVMLLPAPSPEEKKGGYLYDQLIIESEIVDVGRDLFDSAFYNQAVTEAFKALDLFVQEKVDRHDLSGTELMQQVFSTDKPILAWTDRKTLSEQNEQKGYQFIFKGSFIGIRSPCTHAKEWVSEQGPALDLILLAQHLLRKAKSAKLQKTKSSITSS